MTVLLAAIPGHVLDDAKRPLFFLLVGFILTFVLARLNTRLARARGGSRLHMSSIVTPGGLHIHHSVFGIVGMVVAGILEFALQPGSPWVEMFALAFGSGAALTLDEFALILHLEDVYWTGEGRASIDAVILGVTFITLLLTGMTPRSIGEVGDLVAMSRWVGSALILSGAAFVIVSYLKGKLSSVRSGSSCRRSLLSGRCAWPSRGRPGRAAATPATRRSWSAPAVMTRAFTRVGSGASTICGTSSAASRTSRCRGATVTATVMTGDLAGVAQVARVGAR